MTLRILRDDLVSVTQGMAIPSSEKLSSFGVEFDSREIKGGELFVALKGESTHGHAFLEQAFSKGASLALVEDKGLLESSQYKERLVVVGDSLSAFWALATWWRRKLQVPIVAVTGSVGKTSVKELIATILLKHSRGSYSLKSYNNHVGVPYTVCRISNEHEWAVVEMGMNHSGEIRLLSKIVEPDVAVVTEVVAAHIGSFSNIEGVADEKLSIVEGLGGKGTLIINGDTDVIQDRAIQLCKEKGIQLLKFGKGSGLDAEVQKVKSRGLDGIEFTIKLQGDSITSKLSVLGRHNAINAACAALAAKTLVPALNKDEIMAGLRDYTAPLMRLNLKAMQDGRLVLDDSYNANPGSMMALLDIGTDLISSGMKVGMVLGDMLELGSFSQRYHTEMGERIAKIGPSFLISVGEFRECYLEAPRKAGINVSSATSPEEAAVTVRGLPFDIVLIKGSRGVKLDRTVKILLEGNN